MSLELHVETRGDLRPDPEFDSIQGIFYSIFNDVPPDSGTRHETGAIIVDADSANQIRASSSSNKKDRNVSHDPVPGQSKAHDKMAAGSKGSQKDKLTILEKSGIVDLEVVYVKNEVDLIQTFIDFVKKYVLYIQKKKTCVKWSSKIDKTKILLTNGSLMKVESIAECSHSAILLTCIKR